ncbi:isochorismatase family protein [Nocardioides humi]|uniref:Isochorismatase-like domain-containing protein n=1 Tax=Nocardioides humi TaxID=449461 RepID=A0ABN2AAV9_9ACTN|nr:isochorismatase family protein [Nocardioides humi]
MAAQRSLPAIGGYRLDPDTAADANRTDWTVDPARAVLLVHDMQRYFVDAFDRTDPAAQINVAVATIGRLASQARALGIPVVYTAQPPDQSPGDRGLLSDFWGHGLTDDGRQAIIPELGPQPGDIELTKWRYSAFTRTDLRERMRARRRDQLVITGVYAHIGCLTTAIVAFMDDVQVFLVPDAMADFSHDEHVSALEYGATRCANVKRADLVSAELAAAELGAPEVIGSR